MIVVLRATTLPKLDSEIALAIAIAHEAYLHTDDYLEMLRRRLEWPSLTRQTLHCWESGASRVPAPALVAAADLAGSTVDALLAQARRRLELAG